MILSGSLGLFGGSYILGPSGLVGAITASWNRNVALILRKNATMPPAWKTRHRA
jgi:hypothetical protein